MSDDGPEESELGWGRTFEGSSVEGLQDCNCAILIELGEIIEIGVGWEVGEGFGLHGEVGSRELELIVLEFDCDVWVLVVGELGC